MGKVHLYGQSEQEEAVYKIYKIIIFIYKLHIMHNNIMRPTYYSGLDSYRPYSEHAIILNISIYEQKKLHSVYTIYKARENEYITNILIYIY